RPARCGCYRVWLLCHFSITRACERHGRLNLHLPANAGGECNASCSTSGVEGLRLVAATSYNKLFRPGDRCPELTGEPLAWSARFIDLRFAIRGILLRQFVKRAAIRQRCLLQT